MKNNLKALRKQNKMTQEELATLTNISIRTLQDYEQNRKDLYKASINTLLKLSWTLNTPIKNIIDTKSLKDNYINDIAMKLAEIELDESCHLDYIEDYNSELEFYLSNAIQDDYNQYINEYTKYIFDIETIEEIKDLVINIINDKYN